MNMNIKQLATATIAFGLLVSGVTYAATNAHKILARYSIEFAGNGATEFTTHDGKHCVAVTYNDSISVDCGLDSAKQQAPVSQTSRSVVKPKTSYTPRVMNTSNTYDRRSAYFKAYNR